MLEFAKEETFETQEVQIPRPQVKVEQGSERYGKFVVEPLPQGYGTTLGNPLRRILLGSIPGSAITWVKIEGVQHEYSSLPHVKEDATEILLNLKGVRLRSNTGRPGRLRLEVSGEGEVTAGDIITSAEFQVVNPELHIATLDSPDAKLSMEMNVERGTGYLPASQGENGLSIGVLPVDAIFTPAHKVNYTVESTRVGQVTTYERLVLEVWTDGTIAPVEAVRKAASILLDHLFLFSGIGATGEAAEKPPRLSIPAEQYNMPVEKLELSARTLNCLKRAHINKVGEALEKTKEELLEIRNFGEKSLDELYSRLRDRGLLPQEEAEAQAKTTSEEAPSPGDEKEVKAPGEEA